MLNDWRNKNAWEVILNHQEHVYLFRLQGAEPSELQAFLDEMAANRIEGVQQNAAGFYSAIRKGDLVFAVSAFEAVQKLLDVWLPKYKTFCDFIRLKQKWEEVLIFVNRQPRVAFRTKIEGVDPHEVEQAQQFLQEFMVDSFVEEATFDSETIQRGDKVLMVSNPISANNLRRVWAVEKEKNTLPKPFKPKPRLGKGKRAKKGKGQLDTGKFRQSRKPKTIETVEIDYLATPETSEKLMPAGADKGE
ncbi:MAG: hypothetical protein ACI4OR_02195 [Alphaproteobacteria bacterium]